jgi:malto-oligosyltrehalose synthase
MTPRATMRLQFHKGFTFADAERHAPYFARLGISHVYASPITTARAGSMHGYDVIDPMRINPELGGEDGLRRLVATLRATGLGLIVDIVPNHMAVGPENPWWFDVLKHGQASRYAAYFDIDWNADDETLRGKVLLPVLGKPLRHVLAAGEITIVRENGGLVARYFENRFPIANGTDEAQGLAVLLSRQHYRLAWWRVANDEINWRRFFDINELAGLRMEHPAAFDDVHALVFRLYAEGLIDGVRVDHIDGLSDPASYCRTLRQRLDELTVRRPLCAPRGHPYIVVEKILLRGESLDPAWNCDGTSGYDFMNDVSAVQHDAQGNLPLAAAWTSISGRSADFALEEQAARREILARSFSAQLKSCAAAFHRVERAQGLEVSRASLRRALVELLAHFPVYRTYGSTTERPPQDIEFLDAALAGAKSTCLSTDRVALDQIYAWLAARDATASELQDRAVTQFQQLSAPIAAKAVEDTAFYRYGKLLSRNDVGFDVRRFSDGAADFHKNVLRRQAGFPHGMLATATHDHKRGEDTRARLAVLSEHPGEWARIMTRWIARCRRVPRENADPRIPSDADIAMLLQTIVGAWPLDLDIGDDEAREVFTQRLAQWQQKSLREAKLVTDWSIPNDPYEAAARELLLALVARNADPTLLADIAAFVERIAPAGAVNGLAQTLLKLTVPGVPDIYQGTELWDFSLVDPDNRRPVDFAVRNEGLDAGAIDALVDRWPAGFVKQMLIARTLAVRRASPDLFSNGSYELLNTSGPFADHIVAFARRNDAKAVVTVVPRVASALLRDRAITFEPSAWKDTALTLPNGPPLRNIFDEEVFNGGRAEISLLFKRLPVALLITDAA